MDAVSNEVARLMALAGIADDDDSPRALATVLCVSEGIEPREALERMGYDVPAEGAEQGSDEPEPERVPFAELEEGQRFLLNDLAWRKTESADYGGLPENAQLLENGHYGFYAHVSPERLVTPLL